MKTDVYVSVRDLAIRPELLTEFNEGTFTALLDGGKAKQDYCVFEIDLNDYIMSDIQCPYDSYDLSHTTAKFTRKVNILIPSKGERKIEPDL